MYVMLFSWKYLDNSDIAQIKVQYRFLRHKNSYTFWGRERARILKWIVLNLYSMNNSVVSSSPWNLTTFNFPRKSFLNAFECDFDTLILVQVPTYSPPTPSPRWVASLPRLGHRSWSPQNCENKSTPIHPSNVLKNWSLINKISLVHMSLSICILYHKEVWFFYIQSLLMKKLSDNNDHKITV